MYIYLYVYIRQMDAEEQEGSGGEGMQLIVSLFEEIESAARGVFSWEVRL